MRIHRCVLAAYPPYKTKTGRGLILYNMTGIYCRTSSVSTS